MTTRGDPDIKRLARKRLADRRGQDRIGVGVALKTGMSERERETLALLTPLDEDKISGLTYAPGKWTLKEVVGHLADDERIFAYRALCIARADDEAWRSTSPATSFTCAL